MGAEEREWGRVILFFPEPLIEVTEINSKAAKENKQATGRRGQFKEGLAHIIGKCGWIPGLSSRHPGAVSVSLGLSFTQVPAGVAGSESRFPPPQTAGGALLRVLGMGPAETTRREELC